jgi:hypothetical protein
MEERLNKRRRIIADDDDDDLDSNPDAHLNDVEEEEEEGEDLAEGWME